MSTNSKLEEQARSASDVASAMLQFVDDIKGSVVIVFAGNIATCHSHASPGVDKKRILLAAIETLKQSLTTQQSNLIVRI